MNLREYGREGNLEISAPSLTGIFYMQGEEYSMKKSGVLGLAVLLALAGGSYLSAEIRRSSTFVYAAYLALHTGRLVRAPIDVGILERQLCEWIGEDWKELVDNPDMQQAKARRRGSFFS